MLHTASIPILHGAEIMHAHRNQQGDHDGSYRNKHSFWGDIEPIGGDN
jgi:hypothetical protein